MIRTLAWLTTACLALACSGKEEGTGAQSEAPAAHTEAAAAQSAGAALDARWIFSEFDWGDSEDTVYESVEYTDGFLCYRHKFKPHCMFVKTRIDGEEMLARFATGAQGLWRSEVLTPDLDATQAGDHLERVWKLLAAHPTRFFDEAPEQIAFPDWRALAPGELRVTHHWKLPDQEIRVLVGRSQDDPEKWFVSLRSVDPQRAGEEPAFAAQAATPAPPQPSETASPTS